jgi:hypothetical protein
VLSVLANQLAAIFQQTSALIDLLAPLIDAGKKGGKTAMQGGANDDLMGTGGIDFDMLKVGDDLFRDKNSLGSFIDLGHGIPPAFSQ